MFEIMSIIPIEKFVYGHGIANKSIIGYHVVVRLKNDVRRGFIFTKGENIVFSKDNNGMKSLFNGYNCQVNRLQLGRILSQLKKKHTPTIVFEKISDNYLGIETK